MKRFAALVALALTVCVAHAEIAVTQGTLSLGTEVLVFNAAGLSNSGPIVQGQTQTTGIVYDIDAGGEDLTTPSTGIFRVEATDGAFSTLNIAPNIDGAFFTKIVFDINASADGMVSFNVTDDTGATTVTTSFFLSGNGSNPFTIESISGPLITGVTINPTVAMTDVRSFRVGGSVVPEPASITALAAGALLLLRRRSRRGT